MAQNLVHSVRSYDTSDETSERAFLEALQMAAMQCQANVAQKAWEKRGAQGMATGLLMWVGIWPRAYVLCIGSSRMYQFVDGQLERLTDKMGFQLTVNQGVGTDSGGANRAGANVSRGLLGDSSSLPALFSFEQGWGRVGLMCTKGLTNLVSEEQKGKRLSTATSAKQACQELLEDALSAGGSENITMIIGRTRPNPGS